MKNNKAFFISLDLIINIRHFNYIDSSGYAAKELCGRVGAINALGLLKTLGYNVHIITNNQNNLSQKLVSSDVEGINLIMSHFTFKRKKESVIDSIEYTYLDLDNPDYIKIQGNNILNIIERMEYIKESCWIIGLENLDVDAGLKIGLYPYFCKNLIKEKKGIYDFVFDYRNENDKLMFELRELHRRIMSNLRVVYKGESNRYKEIIKIFNERKIKIPFETCFIYVE